MGRLLLVLLLCVICTSAGKTWGNGDSWIIKQRVAFEYVDIVRFEKADHYRIDGNFYFLFS